jgi:hypothetical protein
MANWSKQFLIEFVELYWSLECVWKVKSKEYSDRVKKEQAYDVLVTRVKTVDKDANRDTAAKNKIK